jgi:ABC-type transport system involved in cytochrome bd biosynthesis fused ATPase/permease subunit
MFRALARLGRGLEARAGLALLLGLGTAAAGIGVLATSAYLLSAAALRPPVLSLMVAIVGVRAFALGRVACRYLERLVLHDVALWLLGRLRAWFVACLEPLAPGGLDAFRSGELLQRLAGDVDDLQDLLVRALAPPAVALAAVALALLLAGALLPAAAVVLGGGLALGGLAVPLLTWRAGRGLGRRPAAPSPTSRPSSSTCSRPPPRWWPTAARTACCGAWPEAATGWPPRSDEQQW